MTVEAAFARIYARNVWNGVETLSGPGSGTASTQRVVPELLALVEALGVRSVLDVGCGEGWWQPDLPAYVGVDVVVQAVEAARRRHPDRTYGVADARYVPFRAFDLVLSRDAMQHLPLADVSLILGNLRASGSRWLLASSYVGGENVDVPPGAFFAVDLSAQPFGLGEPRHVIPDGWGWTDPDIVRDPRKILGLWALHNPGGSA